MSPSGGAFTAHKRSSESEDTGFSFVGCKLTGLGVATSILGRPWGPYARVVFALSYMSSTVRPQGWDDWTDADTDTDTDDSATQRQRCNFFSLFYLQTTTETLAFVLLTCSGLVNVIYILAVQDISVLRAVPVLRGRLQNRRKSCVVSPTGAGSSCALHHQVLGWWTRVASVEKHYLYTYVMPMPLTIEFCRIN